MSLRLEEVWQQGPRIVLQSFAEIRKMSKYL